MAKMMKVFVKRIMVYFYYAGKPHQVNPIYYIRKKINSRSLMAIKSIDDGDLYKYLKIVMEKSGSTGCEYTDYLTLWNHLKKHTPKAIIECGSGISSVLFAYYSRLMREKGLEVQFVSMESEETWHNQIVQLFPEELRDFVQFEYSPRVESKYNEYLGSHYDNIPLLNYDFIFIDGPGLRKVFMDKSYPKCFNADLINILRGSNTISISGFIDQRIDTMWKLKKLIPKGTFRYIVFKKLTRFENLKQSQLAAGIKINE